jgi:hypothetical protein
MTNHHEAGLLSSDRFVTDTAQRAIDALERINRKQA